MKLVFLNFLKNIMIFFCNIIFMFSKIKSNKVLFINFNGAGYGDNPKAICDYLLANYSELKFVWLSSSLEGFPDNVSVVKYGTLRAFYEQATSKIWVYNTRAFARLNKRKKQYYIQLWHGSIGFKFLEAKANMPCSYIKKAKYDGKVTDLMVSDSKLQTEDFMRNFWYNGPILEVGMPRNDLLFELKDDLIYKEAIKDKFYIQKDKKIVLYAPTFRDDGNLSYLKIDFERLISNLEKKIDEKVVLLIRLHPNVETKSIIINFNERILDASNFGDMQELLIMSDLLITDYSSSITDFILLDKPYIRYANDLEAYDKKRGLSGLYFDLPDKILKTESELYEHSVNIWQDFDYISIEKFKDNKLKPIFNGHSSKIVSDIIYNVSKE